MSSSESAIPSTVHTVLSSEWSAPTNLSVSAAYSSNPVVVVGPEDVMHVFWEEDDQIYHTARQDGVWSAPESVVTGQRAAAIVAPDGVLHLVFTNEFAFQHNVFYVRWQEGEWSLPILVSKTSGMSALPDIAIDSNGVLHAVWADRTPGFDIIYHGWFDGTWLNEPLHNARGSAPVLVFDHRQNVLHLAWQARSISGGPRDVFHVQGVTYNWTLPENLSVSADAESLGVAMVSDEQGVTHVAWQEHTDGGIQIRYVSGSPGNWSPPERLSTPDADAHDVAVVVTQGSQLSVVWWEDAQIAYRRRASDGVWRAIDSLIANDQGLEQLALAGDSKGNLHLVWSGWSGANARDIYYSTRRPVLGHKLFMPLGGVSGS